MNKTILFFIVKNFPKNILLFSKNFYIIFIEDKKGEIIMLGGFDCIYSNERGDCKYDNDTPFCMVGFCCVYFNDCDYCIHKDNCPRDGHGYLIKCIDEE